VGKLGVRRRAAHPHVSQDPVGTEALVGRHFEFKRDPKVTEHATDFGRQAKTVHGGPSERHEQST